jgi:hypothetical protein
MRHAYHELEVFVDGQSVFSYHRAQRIPTVENLLALIEDSPARETVREDLAGKP